ncbi:MAG: 4-hydroxyacetophenone monooxygenase [Mycobacterium sp.]|jgi:cation diffusion facilitator CzcD-associated flavoprotein CzcO|nr:4-hydroxyacetophenone monooxygenase [Mycobacterium sp.]
MTSEFTTVIVGAGFAGLGTAIRLKQKGLTDFVVLERGERPGGTWRDNTYPGAACDIPSALYSYSFAPNPRWSRTYSGSAEILRYIDKVIAGHPLGPRIRLHHNVTGMHFDEVTGRWRVSVDGGEDLWARTVVAAPGPLAEPGFPAIRGRESFRGHTIHSARWDHSYDFTGKKVAVIGTGASAVQIVPELVKVAASVKVFQRTPGWVLPRGDVPNPALAKQLYAQLPVTLALVRQAWYWGHESMALGVVWNSPATRLVELIAKAHLRMQVRDPWLRRQLTPQFRAGCKRLLISNDYYPALQRDNCALITWPIARISPHGIRSVEGVEHRVDCIVFATGFDVPKQTSPIPITGLHGRDLATEWRTGAQAYRSVAVSGYPNLYFTFGPNSGPGHNSALVYMEAQIDWIVQAIRTVLDEDLHSLDVRGDAQQRYNAALTRRLRRTTWNSGCSSWYLTDDGVNATMYPGFATQFVRGLKSVNRRDFTARGQAG